LVEKTNDARSAEGLPTLDWSECAAAAARERATALVGEELAHEPLGDVIERCAPGGRAAENLVESEPDAVAVVEAWMASAGHRNNIVDPVWDEIGVGCRSTATGMVCSQLFLTGG
jgi:uncharacterized protein YkwD